MKGKYALVLPGILAFSILSSTVKADDKKEIEQGYKKLVTALKAKSLEGVMAVGTSDFSMKAPGINMNTEQVKMQLKQTFAMMKSTPKVTMSIDKMSIKGKTAEVRSTGNMTMEIVDATGNMGAKGQKHIMSDMAVSKDTWVKTDKGWRMKVTESITEKTTLDGKLFTPPGAPAPKK
jgi:ketosteroid isomerase-like protein